MYAGAQYVDGVAAVTERLAAENGLAQKRVSLPRKARRSKEAVCSAQAVARIILKEPSSAPSAALPSLSNLNRRFQVPGFKFQVPNPHSLAPNLYPLEVKPNAVN